MVFRDGIKHIHFWWVSLMLSSGMGIFFAPNASIMPIDFAIRMKCGLITEHKTFIQLIFFMFLLHINTELFALSLVSCSYGLSDLQFVRFYYQRFPCYPPNCRWRYQGLHTCSSYRLFGESARPSLLLLLAVQIFLLCTGGLCLQISFSRSKSALLFVTSWKNFFTNARCTVSFEFVQASKKR